jgi:hypothetical protein
MNNSSVFKSDILSILLRMFIEEKTLFKIEGYADYSENRKRRISLIW